MLYIKKHIIRNICVKKITEKKRKSRNKESSGIFTPILSFFRKQCQLLEFFFNQILSDGSQTLLDFVHQWFG